MDTQLLKLFNGHVYFNLKVLKTKVANEIPSFIRNQDILNYFPKGEGPFGKKTMKELPFKLVNRLIAEIRVSVYDPNGSILKTADVYDEWSENVFLPFCEYFDEKFRTLRNNNNLNSLYSLAEELDKVMIDHFRLVRYGIPVHNIGMNLITRYLLKRFLGEKGASEYFPILISGLEHKLKETNDLLHELAFLIQKSPKLVDLFQKVHSQEFYERLNELSEIDKEVEEFSQLFKTFLQNYGDRGFTREPYYPRWGEEPKYVIEILKSLIIEQDKDLDSIKEKNNKYRRLISDYVEAKIRNQRLGFLKWKLFSIILNFSKKYIIFRETQRFNLDKWITRNRRVYLKIGNIFYQYGILEDPIDVFFLRRVEIKNLINNHTEKEKISKIKQKVKERSDKFKEYENSLPPKFLYGSREFNDILEYDKYSKVFRGIPASQGIRIGRVRVLNTIENISNVHPDDILIVPRTDPGWTPVFSKIGGLITETGGVLSHGAVVSREYGIPAVTNITNACKIFQTGQKVKINGYNGEIRILKK